jgi:hypothetical protein
MEIGPSAVIIWIVAILINILISRAVALAAERRNRSFWAFFWLSFFFSFIIMGIIVASLPLEPESQSNESTSLAPRKSAAYVACPFCAEDVKPQAILCKHCGSKIEPVTPTALDEPDQSQADNLHLERVNGSFVMVNGECPNCHRVSFYSEKIEGKKVSLCILCKMDGMKPS